METGITSLKINQEKINFPLFNMNIIMALLKKEENTIIGSLKYWALILSKVSAREIIILAAISSINPPEDPFPFILATTKGENQISMIPIICTDENDSLKKNQPIIAVQIILNLETPALIDASRNLSAWKVNNEKPAQQTAARTNQPYKKYLWGDGKTGFKAAIGREIPAHSI